MKRILLAVSLIIFLGINADAFNPFVVCSGQPAAESFAYNTQDCFDTGTDGDDLATVTNWSLNSGSAYGAELDDAANYDDGPCSSGSMAVKLDGYNSATARRYARTLTPGSTTLTLSFSYGSVSEGADNKRAQLVAFLDSGDDWIMIIARYTNAAGADDLQLYYDSNDDGTADTYVEICAACLDGNGDVIEAEFNLSTDTVVFWVDTTAYNNGGGGWDVDESTIAKLAIATYSEDNNSDSWVDSLRTYDEARNAAY